VDANFVSDDIPGFFCSRKGGRQLGTETADGADASERALTAEGRDGSIDGLDQNALTMDLVE